MGSVQWRGTGKGIRLFTLLFLGLCPTLNWTNGLGLLVTFLPDCRRRGGFTILARKCQGDSPTGITCLLYPSLPRTATGLTTRTKSDDNIPHIHFRMRFRTEQIIKAQNGKCGKYTWSGWLEDLDCRKSTNSIVMSFGQQMWLVKLMTWQEWVYEWGHTEVSSLTPSRVDCACSLGHLVLGWLTLSAPPKLQMVTWGLSTRCICEHEGMFLARSGHAINWRLIKGKQG